MVVVYGVYVAGVAVVVPWLDQTYVAQVMYVVGVAVVVYVVYVVVIGGGVVYVV